MYSFLLIGIILTAYNMISNRIHFNTEDLLKCLCSYSRLDNIYPKGFPKSMFDKVTVPKLFQTLTPNVDFKEIPQIRYRDCIFQIFFSKERIKTKE